MDQVRIGKCIAALRRRSGLTQETLGEKLGVTNKTVSRWENGNYMPDVEMLQLLSRELQVSVDDLLSGERLPEEERRQEADETGNAASGSDAFSVEERKVYFQKSGAGSILRCLPFWFSSMPPPSCCHSFLTDRSSRRFRPWWRCRNMAIRTTG